MKGPSPPNLPARPVVNDLLTLHLAHRLEPPLPGKMTPLHLNQLGLDAADKCVDTTRLVRLM